MSRTINPYDSVTLTLLLKSFGESIGTLYPVAHVYDNANAEITDSPFTLTHVANNLYVKSDAFQADVDSGTYKVVYLVYTDAGHTTRSSSHGEDNEIITVKIQSTTGIGSNSKGGDVYVDLDPILTKMKELEKQIKSNSKEMKDIKKSIDSGLDISLPKDFNSDITGEIADLKNRVAMISLDIKSNTNFSEYYKKIVQYILYISKDITNKITSELGSKVGDQYKKELISAIEAQVIDAFENTVSSEIKSMNKDFENKGQSLLKMFNKQNSKFLDSFYSSINDLNESIRKKLLTTVQMLKMTGGKSNINIKLEKND